MRYTMAPHHRLFVIDPAEELGGHKKLSGKHIRLPLTGLKWFQLAGSSSPQWLFRMKHQMPKLVRHCETSSPITIAGTSIDVLAQCDEGTRGTSMPLGTVHFFRITHLKADLIPLLIKQVFKQTDHVEMRLPLHAKVSANVHRYSCDIFRGTRADSEYTASHNLHPFLPSQNVLHPLQLSSAQVIYFPCEQTRGIARQFGFWFNQE